MALCATSADSPMTWARRCDANNQLISSDSAERQEHFAKLFLAAGVPKGVPSAGYCTGFLSSNRDLTATTNLPCDLPASAAPHSSRSVTIGSLHPDGTAHLHGCFDRYSDVAGGVVGRQRPRLERPGKACGQRPQHSAQEGRLRRTAADATAHCWQPRKQGPWFAP